jgi:hypothetical protein
MIFPQFESGIIMIKQFSLPIAEVVAFSTAACTAFIELMFVNICMAINAVIR